MTWRKKCVELAKKIVRSKGRCDKCGSEINQLHGAHVISERYSTTCADLRNLMCLCASCHKLAKDSWHESPTKNWEWFEHNWPGRREYLDKKSQEITRYRDKDWQLIYQDLKDIERRTNDQQTN